MQKHKQTDNTADNHRKQDTRGASVNHTCVNIHFQRASEALKLMNFLLEYCL